MPEPEDEKDLTTYIRKWKEEKEKIIKYCDKKHCVKTCPKPCDKHIIKNCAKHCVRHAVRHCQVSEDVIRKMLDTYGDALASYNGTK